MIPYFIQDRGTKLVGCHFSWMDLAEFVTVSSGEAKAISTFLSCEGKHLDLCSSCEANDPRLDEFRRDDNDCRLDIRCK